MFHKEYNYLIKIEYDGSSYVGWQYQKNGRSIQGKIENALGKILKMQTRLIGAGRTDKGVHAFGQYANFKKYEKIIDIKKFLNSINFFLGKSLISIISIKKKDNSFNARHNAKERIYEYKIINREGALSLYKNKAWHIKKKLDVKIMKKGAKILKGTHNFSTFRSSSCEAQSPIKTLKKVTIVKKKSKIILTFMSKSFLQQQVRSMVGCLKYVGEKKWNLKKFTKVMASKKRTLCAPPAPPEGLYLARVIY
mgnify:CR=1 FL=1